jgi:hypothetical protein
MTFVGGWITSTRVGVTAPSERRLPGVAVIGHRYRWILLGALLGCLVGLTALPFRPPVYESTAYLIVIGPPAEPAQGFSRAAQALTRLSTAPGIMSFRLNSAGLTAAAQEPRRYIRAQASPDAPVISITGMADTPEAAQLTAETVVDGLSSVRTLGPFQVDVVTRAQSPRAPRTPTWFVPASGTAIGAGLALVLAAAVPVGLRRRSNGWRGTRRPGRHVSAAVDDER